MRSIFRIKDLTVGEVASRPSLVELSALLPVGWDIRNDESVSTRRLEIGEIGERAEIGGEKNSTVKRFNLSAAQRGMLLQSLVSKEESTYIEQFLYPVSGKLDVSMLEKAWDMASEAIPMLRVEIDAIEMKQEIKNKVKIPVKEIIIALRRHGTEEIAVDGAHSLGSTDIDVEGMGADFFFTNFHKWGFLNQKDHKITNVKKFEFHIISMAGSSEVVLSCHSYTLYI